MLHRNSVLNAIQFSDLQPCFNVIRSSDIRSLLDACILFPIAISYSTNFSSNAGEIFSALIFAESEISTPTLRLSSTTLVTRVEFFLSRLFFSQVYYFVITNKVTRTLFAFWSLREGERRDREQHSSHVV